MRRPAYKIIFALLLVCFASCKKDDYHYPDLLTDMVEVDTDSKGIFRILRTDDKTEYLIQDNIGFEDNRPDTTYRVRCRFSMESQETVALYGIKLIASPHPELESYFKSGVKKDPVKLISIWKSGDYINLHIGIMTKDEYAHKVHFVKSEPHPTQSGRQRVDLLLFHNQGDDFEAYTQEAFLSCPLSTLELEEGDSVYFSLQTYDGLKTFGFER